MNKYLILFSVAAIALLVIFSSAPGEQIKTIANGDPGISIRQIQSTGTGTSGTSGTLKPDLNFGQLPLYFIANKGQVKEKAKFYARAARYTLWLTKEGLVFDRINKVEVKAEVEETTIPQAPGSHPRRGPYKASQEGRRIERDVSCFIFLDANKNPGMVPVEETKLRVNYFKGNDKSKWHGDIPTSKAVLYKNLYKNVDLKVYGIEKQIEYDWMVKPGGNPGDIRFRYKNVNSTRLDKQGNLLVKTDFGEFIHKRPLGYQKIGKERVKVKAAFKPINPGENIYGFAVGEYDKNCELIIDPVVLAYSTYLGGMHWDFGEGTAVALDSSGYTYVTGLTYSTDFPILNQYQADQPDWDAFLTKIDTTQSGTASLLYSTYLGGDFMDFGGGITADNSGNAYVTGDTWSTNFPTLNQYQTDPGDGTIPDAFVTKIDTTKSGVSSLVYSTYLGSEGFDYGTGITVDSSGFVYVVGSTDGTGYPTLNQYQAFQGGNDAFITKIDPFQSGTSCLIYSTYLGGTGNDGGSGIAVDNSGYVYVTGGTGSTDFPVLNQYQVYQGTGDAFITTIDPTQSGASCLIYSTYLGGTGDESGSGIALDSNGYVYVSGSTTSTNFPTLDQYQGNQALTDLFITKIDPTQTGALCLVYSTYLGGNGDDHGSGIAVDTNGNVYITGKTDSTNFPTRDQYQLDQTDWDAFVTKIDPTQAGTAGLVYSTYLGGSGEDRGKGIAVDNIGDVYIIGDTYSSDFPLRNEYQSSPGFGYSNVFVTKMIVSALTLDSPNGGENWEHGSTQMITWNSRGVYEDVKITLWKDGSLVGTIVEDIPASPDYYEWTVGQYEGGTAATGTGYTIKIKEKGTTVSDTSDASFIISPSLAVTSPNGGETWPLDSSQAITWNASGVSGTLKITLWKNGGLLGTIAQNLDSSTGSYPWTVGDYIGGTASPGTGYTVKIKEKGTTVSDTSDASFTISEPLPPSITITSPNGGENWAGGSSQNITWNAVGLSANVKITLWKDGGLVGTIVNDLAPSPGSYSWTVGQYEGGTASVGTGYAIKIKEIGTAVSDMSDGTFTITGITVTSPNGGESWQMGTTENITWNAVGLSANVKITLWKDGVLVGTIVNHLASSPGSYAWTVGQYEGGTAAAGTGYTIKIKEIGTAVSDFSDNPFMLTN